MSRKNQKRRNKKRAQIERARQAGSKQQRFSEETSQSSRVWSSSMRFGRALCGVRQPDFTQTQQLDLWMNEVIHKAPVLPGMIAKLVAAYAAQGWTMTGGRRTVNATSDILKSADNDLGWYGFSESVAQSFMMRNMGAFVEMERRIPPRWSAARRQFIGELAQVTNLYNMDSTKVDWRKGNEEMPAQFWPIEYEGNAWGCFDFFHIVSLPGDTDRYEYASKRAWSGDDNRKRGKSPLYRCLESLKLMCLINEWEQSSLDPSTVDAILLLSGADADTFDDAMEARRQAIAEKGESANRLGVLGSFDDEISADLLFLRKPPESLADFESRVRLLYEVYAMNLGKDVSFFFPAQTGNLLGRNTNDVQNIERNTAESNVFHPKFQEMLQKFVIPANVHFEFDAAGIDEEADLNMLMARVDVAKTLYESVQQDGITSSTDYLSTRDEVRSLLADMDSRFDDWTSEDEGTSASDTQDAEARAIRRALELPAVQRALDFYRVHHRDDQIINYTWSISRQGRPTEREYAIGTLAELVRPRVWYVDEKARGLIDDGHVVEVDPVKKKMRISVTEALEDPTVQAMIALMGAGLQAQYEAVDVAALVALIRGSGIDVDDSGAIDDTVDLIADNELMPDAADSIDIEALAALLVVLADLGVSEGGEQATNASIDVTDDVQSAAAGAAGGYADERVQQLYVEATGDEEQPVISDPRLQETLDPESRRAMAGLTVVAMRDNADADVPAVVAEAIPDSTATRAEFIGTNESARAFGYGLFSLAVLTDPRTKTWLRTSAQNPRVAHLEQVGVTVPWSARFPNGNFWSNEEPRCQCDIEVGW